MLKEILLVIQIIVSFLLIASISIQVKGGGLSRNFTAGSFSRRGLEKLIFRSTFVLVSLFILVSIGQLIA